MIERDLLHEGATSAATRPAHLLTHLARRPASRGSVLVPVLAAMLILLLAGFALTEMSGAQRLQGVLALESTRAFWLADAGIQHAGFEETAIAVPVSFAGGTYTVAKNGTVYTSTGTRNAARRVITEDLGTLPDGIPGPLSEPASVATAAKKDGKNLRLNLVSVSPSNAVVAAFDLSSNVATVNARKLKLASTEIWASDVALPIAGMALNKGTTADRTIDAGTSPEAIIEWASNPAGTVTYTLVLYFVDGSSSRLVFSITWT